MELFECLGLLALCQRLARIVALDKLVMQCFLPLKGLVARVEELLKSRPFLDWPGFPDAAFEPRKLELMKPARIERVMKQAGSGFKVPLDLSYTALPHDFPYLGLHLRFA